MNPVVILVTNNFPYFPGEYFLESEVKYWAKSEVDFIILPNHEGNNIKRTVHNNIKVDDYLLKHKKKNIFRKLVTIIAVIFSNIFWKEIFYNNRNRLNYRFIISHSKRVAEILTKKKLFEDYIDRFNDGKGITLYFYWNDVQSYAATMIKKKLNLKVVSRIHGYDLYKERKRNRYMPLKWQFKNGFDKIYAISLSGKKYLEANYGFDAKQVEVSKLGVESDGRYSRPSEDSVYNILSCSSCIPIKRIDKIVDALYFIGQRKKEYKIIWHHIGDGPLKNELELYANKKLSGASNITFSFTGFLENKDVHRFYTSHKIDVFVNTSETEGVPVTIMEAMSHGVPVIAPDVGGVSEIVNEKNGILLSEKASVQEIVEALYKSEILKREKIRHSAYAMWSDNYNAKKNYSEFIHKIQVLNGN